MTAKIKEIKKQASYFLEEVAVLVRVSESTVKRAVKKGNLQVKYVGKSPRVLHSELLKWLEYDPFLAE